MGIRFFFCSTALLICLGGCGNSGSEQVPGVGALRVDAGPEQTLAPGASTTLSGSAEPAASVVSYRWEQRSGPLVELSTPTQAITSLIAPVIAGPARLVFRLSVIGTAGLHGFDEVALDIAGPDVNVDAGRMIAPILPTQLGVNQDPFQPADDAQLVAALRGLNTKLLRWPGGFADDYHWQTNSDCRYGKPQLSFDAYMTGVALPLNADVVINVPYGANGQCNGPADAAEAAAWVDYANNQKNYGVKYWSIGNEAYFPSAYDLHPQGQKNDPGTYARAVTNQFYPQMKGRDPSIKIGVVIGGNQSGPPEWDQVVLANARYDFVEMHIYPQNPGGESDAGLLTKGVAAFPAGFAKVRAELAAAGRAGTPILLGEFNSVSSRPGKQSVSIVNALFMGMAYAEALKARIELIAPFAGSGRACVSDGNNSASLYGFQNFGIYDAFSAGTYDYPNSACSPGLALGTQLPLGSALQLIARFATPGEHLLTALTADTQPQVRAYASSVGAGFALLLFNLDASQPITLTAGVSHARSALFNATLQTYDKALYDQSAAGRWLAPSAPQNLGTLSLPLQVTLPPWSMNLLLLTPAD